MKKFLGLIGLIFLSYAVCFGEKAVDPFTWDFGQVKQGEVVSHNFILKNDSSRALKIIGVNTSCGCTVSETKKKVLAPQESTEVAVKFNSKGYLGAVQQFVYVNTDDTDTSTKLSVNGEQSRTIDKPVIKFIIEANVIK